MQQRNNGATSKPGHQNRPLVLHMSSEELVIRLSRHLHLQKVRARTPAPTTAGPDTALPATDPGSSDDY
ncbi:hypothetical protein [Streptomyces sp. NPDC049813]|uniref:hypothetical protein n=1 Tax=Streptomyces sp. NPDC049813 TaxID=3365597 RepID=UPI00379602B8